MKDVFTVCAAAVLLWPAWVCAQEKAEPAPAAAAVAEEADAEGNTPLIRASIHLATLLSRDTNVPEAAMRAQVELVRQLLAGGADPLRENRQGCNALFYLHSYPGLVEELRGATTLPPELAVRIPAGRQEFLHYISLRAAQTRISHGNRDYLSHRYCKPANERCRELVEELLQKSELSAEETTALADALTVMRAADADKAADYIDSLPLWQHGEQMMQPVPLILLNTLQELHWTPNVANLRTALDKLASMLPASKEDMIDCAAARPVRVLLHMLVYQEGPGAKPELERLAKAYDPDAACTAMELLLHLSGRHLPEPQAEPATPLERLAETYRVDDAVYHGRWQELPPAAILRAADCMRNLPDTPCPLHAAMLESMVKDGNLCVEEDDALNLRYSYEEIDEPVPRRLIIKRLLEHADTYFTPPPPAAPAAPQP